jgi:mevalonate kinase
MIPSQFIPLWKTGLNSDLFYLKLCGSGGGGFLTAFAKDATKAFEFLQMKTIYPVLSI